MPFLLPNQQLQSTEGKIQVRKQKRNRLLRAVVLWSVQLVVQQCQQPAEMMQMNSATLAPAVHVVLLSAAAAVPLSDDESVASWKVHNASVHILLLLDTEAGIPLVEYVLVCTRVGTWHTDNINQQQS